MANIAEIMELYTAYFNRAADRDGVDYWAKEMDTKAWTLDDVAKSFADQPEYDALYAGKTNAQIVALVYTNVLGRAAEAAGANYWETQLNDGAVPVSQLIQAVVNSATEKDANGDYVHATDAAIVNNKTAVSQYAYDSNVNAKDISLAGVTEDEASTQSAKNQIDAKNPANIGETFMLTTGSDKLTGTDKNDLFTSNVEIVNGTVAGTGAIVQNLVNSLQATDRIDGGAGIDTLDLITQDAATKVELGNISNVEIMNVKGLGQIAIDTTTITDLTNLNITEATKAVSATAAGTTNVDVSMKASAAAASTVAVVGGKDVNVALTDVHAATVNDVTIGTGTQAKGAVTVSMTGAKYVAGNTDALSDVTVTGGTSVSVTQVTSSDTSAAATDGAAGIMTQGAVKVTADANTETVTIKQDASQGARDAVAAVAGVATTQTLEFKALAAGENVTLVFSAGNSLTFTAKKAMTADLVAKAFANLEDLDTQTDSGNVQYGIWTGTGNIANAGKWTTGEATSVDADTAKVTFSNADSTAAAITFTGSTASKVANDTTGHVAGVDAKTAVTGQMGIKNGIVTIDDSAAKTSIKTITVDGYAATSTIGGTNATTALENLTLKNSGLTIADNATVPTASADMKIADTAETLNLTLEKVGYDATVTSDVILSSSPKTLNVTSTGDNFIDLEAKLTETLNVSGTGVLTINEAAPSDLLKVATIKVSDTAGLTLGTLGTNAITSVDTTATTGTVTVEINSATATYKGGAGNDIVTIKDATVAIAKTIDLGNGDNTLDLSAGKAINPTATGKVTAGTGTDTLKLSIAAAVNTALSADTSFASKFTGFDRLVIADVVGNTDATQDTFTVDLEALGFSYVATNGTIIGGTAGTDDDILVLDNMANNGTLRLDAAGTGAVNSEHIVNIKDATTGTADVLNVITNAATGDVLGTVTANKVETINVTVNDTDLTSTAAGVENVSTNTLELNSDTATTINVNGAGNVVLTLDNLSTEVATINGSTATGILNITTSAVDTAATTVTGGAGDDIITLQGANDVAIGGAGNDTLKAVGVAATFVSLTGGEGLDTFDVSGFLASSAGAAVQIKDLQDNEIIKFEGHANSDFISTKVTIDPNSGLVDAVTTATQIAYDGGNTNGIAWFQLGTDTYIVQDLTDNGVWTNGSDIVVKISGLVDLSGSSYNATTGTLEYNEIA